MNIPADARPLDESVSPDVIEAFTAAIATTFQEMCAVEIAFSEPFVFHRLWPGDVVASIVLKRSPPGLLELSFRLSALEPLASRYLADVEASTPELVDDAAGEFANVIGGQAKTMLKGSANHFQLSPFVVRRGGAIAELIGDRLTWICECEFGSFAVQANLPANS